jgi:ParB/RepB/Spo0J family partition protein
MVATLNQAAMKKIKVKTFPVIGTVEVDPDEIGGAENASRWNVDKTMAANYGHTDESIDKMAESFAKHGQLQNVLARRDEDGTLKMVAGFGRWLGAKAYNGAHPDKPMRLKVSVIDCTPEEAAALASVENRERNATSPIDDAHAHERMRRDYQWTDAKIAEEFDQDAAHVCRLKRLLKLPPKLQALVHVGLVPIQTGYQMAALGRTEQEEILKAVKQNHKEELKRWKELDQLFDDVDDGQPETPEEKPTEKPHAGNGKKKGTVSETARKKVKEAKRKKEAAAPASSKKPASSKARDYDTVKDFFRSLTGDVEEANLRDFCTAFLVFCAGKGSETDYEKLLRDSLKAPEPAKAE